MDNLIKNSLIFVFAIVVFSCQRPDESANIPLYQLAPDDKGIMVEVFDSTNTDESRYNHNNKVYIPGTRFVYHYSYEDSTGKPFFFRFLEEDWEFVPADQQDSTTVTSLIIRVRSGLSPFIQWYPDYNQTILTYTCPPKATYEIVGKEAIDTPLGSMQCYKIQARGKSPLGESSLVSWYNEEIGFVTMDYINPDGSKCALT